MTKFVPLSGTLHLLPENFGIVNESVINLIAQIPGKSTEPRNLVIQIDTHLHLLHLGEKTGLRLPILQFGTLIFSEYNSK